MIDNHWDSWKLVEAMIAIVGVILLYWAGRLYLAYSEVQVLTPQSLKAYLDKQKNQQVRTRVEAILKLEMDTKPITREMYFDAVAKAKLEAEEQRQIVAQREAMETR
jgi:hypothetical protein